MGLYLWLTRIRSKGHPCTGHGDQERGDPLMVFCWSQPILGIACASWGGGRNGHLNGNRGTESEGPDGMCSKRTHSSSGEKHLYFPFFGLGRGILIFFPDSVRTRGGPAVTREERQHGGGHPLVQSWGWTVPSQLSWSEDQVESKAVSLGQDSLSVCALGILQTGSTGKATLVVFLESEISGARSFWSVASASAEPPQYLPALWQRLNHLPLLFPHFIFCKMGIIGSW